LKNVVDILSSVGSFPSPEARPEPSADAGIPFRYILSASILIFALMLALSALKMKSFDYGLTHLLNSAAGHSVILDDSMRVITREMFSNLLLVTLVWYAWFNTEDTDARAKILLGVIISYIAGSLSRVIQLGFPAHPRPLHDAALHFRRPLGVDPDIYSHWSSFPSDHATVFFGLAATVFIVNRKLGRIGFLLASVLALARVYNGYHYPTDVIGGAMLGIIFVGLTQNWKNSRIIQRLMASEANRKPVFYAAAFYVSFGVATLFNDYRAVGAGAAHILKTHFQH
jgi:undecaprenyl-diphosphatase